jgi:hypothetical protein
MTNTKKIIIAIETTPKGEDVDVGFMVSPKCRTIEEKLKGLRSSVDNGSYLKWSGKNRVKFVSRVLGNGNKVDFRVFEGVFNGKTQAGVGLTVEQ